MEAATSQIQKGHQLFATPIFKLRTQEVFSPVCNFILPASRKLLKKGVLNVGCAKGVSISSTAHKTIMANEELEEEIIGIEKLSVKCEGHCGGIVELLECLESEAIMGEDEGTEPDEYNRRAQIFDKSSRVFQALKHNSAA